MYLLDPGGGRRRRAGLNQKTHHAAAQAARAGRVASTDSVRRARGALHRAIALFHAEQPDDRVLAARVRSQLGRLTAHPHAIQVRARNGTVELSGPILRAEVDQVLRGVHHVRGVKTLDSRLEVHSSPAHVPALQGAGPATGPRMGLRQRNWSPALRLAAGSGGLGLVGYGFVRRGAMGAGLGTVGTAVLARALSNRELRRLVGIGAGRRAVDLHKTLNVEAPVENVYGFFRNFEGFPRFMRHVREVRQIAGNRFRWSVDGPAGLPFEWEAELTVDVPNRVLAWKSIGRPVVQHAGVIRFQSRGPGSTRIDLRMTYNPPAGALGHAFAHMLGSDPKKQMDEDLLRLRSLVEAGTAKLEVTGIEPDVEKFAPPHGDPMRH